ncbi:hypothetical protein JCM9279_004157 [Rhodotorula babjevae]
MDDSGLAKGKPVRSRAACDPQKCDGPSMIPCRRCMLYSLPCTYAHGASASQKKTAKVATASAPTTTAPQPLQLASSGQAQLDAPTNSLLHDMAARLRSIESAISSLHLSTLSSASSSSRHATASHPSDSPEAGPSPRANSHRSGSDRGGGEAAQGAARSTDMGETAVQAINDAVDLLHKVTSSGLAAFQSLGDDGREAGSGGGTSSSGRASSATIQYEEGLVARILQSEGWTRPDVVDRGVMTEDEVDKTFEIFFTRLAPWTPFFPSTVPDTHAIPEPYSPQAVRTRSPLLFHTILLSTAYFLLPAPGEHSKRVYLGLTSIVNELVAPVIISMSRKDVTTDTSRALMLLIMWKNVQHAHFLSTSPSSPTSSIERHYKNNAVSSASLWALETHLLRTLRIHSTAPHAFAAAVQHAAARGRRFDSAYLATDPAAQHAVDDLRLWYWSLVADVHGALTTGRAVHFSSGETALALRTARALAGFNLQASDVRLVAFVELYEIVREAMRSAWACVGDSILGAEPSSCRWKAEWEGEMDEFNRRIDAWEDEWIERFKASFIGGEAGSERDKLVWSALGNKNLCKAILNASVFYRWTRTRRLAAHGSPSSPRSPAVPGELPTSPAPAQGGAAMVSDLSPAEWRFVQTTVDAIERLVFDVSVQSRVVVPGRAYDGFRKIQWPPPDAATGLRKALEVDSTVAEATKTSHDPVSCVGIVYPLILLSKICNSGLSRCELTTLDKPHDSSTSSSAPTPASTSYFDSAPVRPRAVLPGRKLAVLLSLGAAFLDQVAPTPAHPAAVHSKTLRLILKAGTWGQNGGEATAQAQDEAVERARRAGGGAGPTSSTEAGPFSSAAQLLSAILAQVAPSAPAPQPDAAHVGASTGLAHRPPARTSSGSTSLTSAFRPTSSASRSTLDESAPTSLAGVQDPSAAMHGFSTSTVGGGATAPTTTTTTTSAAALSPAASFFTTTSYAPDVTDPARAPSTAQPFLATSTSFPSFDPFPLAAGLGAGAGRGPSEASQPGLGMEVDADALGALDWPALEKQLGMESGSLSEGFAGGTWTQGDGAPVGTTSYGETMEQLDWMSY